MTPNTAVSSKALKYVFDHNACPVQNSLQCSKILKIKLNHKHKNALKSDTTYSINISKSA